ncbi:hypothetical protein [Rugosimonospora africana]|uniref:Uncharacterized protein n=1 Tax=Rugosimonospora africana TaxID=556532 RepID=A0A8J3VW23_9ACTN|nr:hypothetical protein [Rugosimonospora africana]GIH21297.1 hypothetical protein Raf01_94690 [Rugosimonospora africana]
MSRPKASDGGTGRDRLPPAELVAEAARHPSGSVAEIDRTLIADPNGYIPGEAVRGVWKVDANGCLTGEITPNPEARASPGRLHQAEQQQSLA